VTPAVPAGIYDVQAHGPFGGGGGDLGVQITADGPNCVTLAYVEAAGIVLTATYASGLPAMHLGFSVLAGDDTVVKKRWPDAFVTGREVVAAALIGVGKPAKFIISRPGFPPGVLELVPPIKHDAFQIEFPALRAERRD